MRIMTLHTAGEGIIFYEGRFQEFSPVRRMMAISRSLRYVERNASEPSWSAWRKDLAWGALYRWVQVPERPLPRYELSRGGRWRVRTNWIRRVTMRFDRQATRYRFAGRSGVALLVSVKRKLGWSRLAVRLDLESTLHEQRGRPKKKPISN